MRHGMQKLLAPVIIMTCGVALLESAAAQAPGSVQTRPEIQVPAAPLELVLARPYEVA